MGSLPVGSVQNITQTKYWAEKTKNKKTWNNKKFLVSFIKTLYKT